LDTILNMKAKNRQIFVEYTKKISRELSDLTEAMSQLSVVRLERVHNVDKSAGQFVSQTDIVTDNRLLLLQRLQNQGNLSVEFSFLESKCQETWSPPKQN
jgi:hypothetical protein